MGAHSLNTVDVMKVAMRETMERGGTGLSASALTSATAISVAGSDFDV
jgi:hypothetical protein